MKTLVNDEVVNQIYITKDYSKFKMISGNRVIDQSHVRSIVKKMKRKGGWLDTVEITVNEYFEVIDGQHRLIAAQLLGISVRYKIVRGSGIEEVRETNQGNNNWKLKDHVPSYVSQGIQDYVLLDMFTKKFPEIKLTHCQMLLSNSMSSSNRETFESGQWKVKNFETGVLWGNYLMSLKPYFSGFNRAIFIRGFIKVLITKPEFKFEEFLHKVMLQPTRLVPCGTTHQYVDLIEQIYNYKRKGKVNLRY